MTVEVNDTVERYTISGVGPYAFSFRIFADAELQVVALSTDSPPEVVSLSLLTHYTVSGANDQDGGSVTLTSGAATTYAGYTLDIRSVTSQEQPTSVRNQGRFLPEIHEDAFDRLCRQVQDLSRRVDASFRYPDNMAADGALSPIQSWVSKYLAIGPTGLLEPTTLTSSGALTQSIIGNLLYPRTAAEISAGVTPVNYAYAPGNVLRNGADPTGASDSTAAINAALVSNLNVFIPSGTYLISGSLIWQDNQRIEGAGFLCTTIKGDLASKSFFRSSFGETPSIGQRPVGVHISNLSIVPATAATIASGSVGINFRNAQYCTVVDVRMQYTDIGIVVDQIGQFLRFERVHAQIHNTALWSDETTGGNNNISDCSLGGNVVALDLDGGAWDVSKTDCSATQSTTDYCIRLGRSGGVSTTVHADKMYVEGNDASTITLQVEDSVNRSRVSMHRHSTLGSIVNNAGENCVIEVPGQGFYNPLYRAQRIEFAASVDGAALAGLKANGGSALQARNAADTDYAQFYAMNFLAKRVAITYSASMTPDASAGYTQIIAATNGSAFTINAPTNAIAAGQRLTIQLRNQSGGALGAATWNGNYKMSAWTNPADGFNRSITFEYDGTSKWTQVSQTGADIAN